MGREGDPAPAPWGAADFFIEIPRPRSPCERLGGPAPSSASPQGSCLPTRGVSTSLRSHQWECAQHQQRLHCFTRNLPQRFRAVTRAFSLGILSISDLFISDPGPLGNEVHDPRKHPHVCMHIIHGTLVLMLDFRLLPIEIPGLSDVDEIA
jgi:hypothetical protein